MKSVNNKIKYNSI